MKLDPLHVLLITGFFGFFTALSSHAITKWALSRKYLTKEEFLIQVEIMMAKSYVTKPELSTAMEALVEKILRDCKYNRAKCPLEDIQNDIAEIKEVQKERSSFLNNLLNDLRKQKQAEVKVFREILEALKKNVHEQNEILKEVLV